MKMKMKTTMMILIMLISIPLHALGRSDVLKALVFPGWAQMKYNHVHGKVLIGTEITLLSSLAGVSYYAAVQHGDLKDYARQNANAAVLLDEEQYWVDLGNYISWEEHRDAMLEIRESEKIYDEEYAWHWLDIDNANTYRNIRRDRDISRNRRTMISGALVFNRLLSLVDIIYLNNRSTDLQIGYFEQPGVQGLNLSWRLGE